MKYTYAITDFNEKTGQIDDSDLIWKEGTLEQAQNVVHKDHSKCVLFYHKDVAPNGVPVNKNATKDEFKNNPAVLGVAYYHCWAGYRYE